MYHSIPAQFSRDVKRYRLTEATGKRKTTKDEEILQELIDSKTVLAAYNTTDPRVSLTMTKRLNSYKLYVADTGLFISLLFSDRPTLAGEIYTKLISDKLPANLGYLYENAVAQMIAAWRSELYYHTWEKKGSSHYYEIDFLIANRTKILPVEIKSSGLGLHESLKVFADKFAGLIDKAILLSQKDRSKKEGIEYLPVYMLDCLLKEDSSEN